MQKHSKVLIVGHGEVIDVSLCEALRNRGFEHVFSSDEMGLETTVQASVNVFFQDEKPEYVILTSTRSGGIKANQENGGEFIYHNLQSQNNIIHAAHQFGVKKLLFFAGSCVYPKNCSQPIKEENFLTGPLEKTSEPYSVAKIAGVTLCKAYRQQYDLNAIVAVPATIYGPASDQNIETAHVMGALIGKFARAVLNNESKVEVWGSGKPRREFIYVDDFVEATLMLLNDFDSDQMINVGVGDDISIAELAELIKDVSGFKGGIEFDASKPDGVMQKLLDSQRIENLSYKATTSLREGVKMTFDAFMNQIKEQKVGV